MYDELTQVDIQKMRDEIDYRTRELRPKLIEEVKTARAFGDLSENYEYKAAKQELRRVPFVGWVMEKFRVIFVNRGAHDIAAYQQCVDALEQEHDKMLVFIEGTRCNRDKHVRAKTGAVRMAAVSGAPVVPVFVTRNKTPFCPIRVIFGEPYPVHVDPEDHAACQQASDALLKTIYQLGGDSYADQIS